MLTVEDEINCKYLCCFWQGPAVASVNFLCPFIGLWLVEKIDGRKLLLGPLWGVVLSVGRVTDRKNNIPLSLITRISNVREWPHKGGHNWPQKTML